MTISCQVNTLYDEPLEGIFVQLQCVEHPEYCYMGCSNHSGAIDEWFSLHDHKVRPVRSSPNMEGLHWQMCFVVQPFFHDTCFPEIWNTVWVPKNTDSHTVVTVDKDMYAVFKDDASSAALEGGTLPSHTVSVHPSHGPKVIHNTADSDDVEIRVVTPLPYDRISGFNEPVCLSAGPEGPATFPWQERKPKKRHRGTAHPQQLRRSARLSNS